MTEKEKRICLWLYNGYLRHSAIIQHRGFRLVKSFEKVAKNHQFKIFYAMTYKCIDHGLTSKEDINEFFNKARLYCRDDFIPISFVSDFEEINKVEYKSAYEIEDIYEMVEVSSKYMKKISEEEDIKMIDMIRGGKPPLIMKFWKRGDVDIYTMMTLIDYEAIKKESWYRIFCGNRQTEMNKVLADIRSDNRIKEIVKKLFRKSVDSHE